MRHSNVQCTLQKRTETNIVMWHVLEINCQQSVLNAAAWLIFASQYAGASIPHLSLVLSWLDYGCATYTDRCATSLSQFQQLASEITTMS